MFAASRCFKQVCRLITENFVTNICVHHKLIAQMNICFVRLSPPFLCADMRDATRMNTFLQFHLSPDPFKLPGMGKKKNQTDNVRFECLFLSLQLFREMKRNRRLWGQDIQQFYPAL